MGTWEFNIQGSSILFPPLFLLPLLIPTMHELCCCGGGLRLELIWARKWDKASTQQIYIGMSQKYRSGC